MKEMKKKVLVLTFGTIIEEKLKLTINNPKELTGSEISSIMEEIINAMTFGDERLAAHKVEAKYIILEEERIDL